MLIDGERVKWGVEDITEGKDNEPDDVTLACEFANGETEYVRLAVSPDFVPEEKMQFGENAGGYDGHPAYIAVSITVIDTTAMKEEKTPENSRKLIDSRIVLESQDYKYFEEYYAEQDERRQNDI